jgi:hypothetical protein
LVFDLKGEYASDQTIHARRWESLRDLLAHVAAGGAHGREIVRARVDEFAATLRYAYAAGSMLLVLEELSAFCDAEKYPRQEILDIAHRSRSQQLDVVVLAQRPVRLPTDLRAQAKNFAVYRIDEKQDREEIGRQLGLEPATVLRIGSLARGELLRFSRGF